LWLMYSLLLDSMSIDIDAYTRLTQNLVDAESNAAGLMP
jgi:hypothetical protein